MLFFYIAYKTLFWVKQFHSKHFDQSQKNERQWEAD